MVDRAAKSKCGGSVKEESAASFVLSLALISVGERKRELRLISVVTLKSNSGGMSKASDLMEDVGCVLRESAVREDGVSSCSSSSRICFASCVCSQVPGLRRICDVYTDVGRSRSRARFGRV